MNILIVEDETAAYENLVYLIHKAMPSAVILANTESVEQTVEWLRSSPHVDLIFMDIQLSDGSAFSIFDQIKVTAPIIFTTAYDQYALDAFKVNSIDYLLKPITYDDLQRALDKFRGMSSSSLSIYLSSLNSLTEKPRFAGRFLVPDKDKLIPVNVASIACVYSTNRHTEIFMTDGRILPVNKSLDQLISSLNPAHFFRANKQFIISRDAINDLTIWFDSRLRVSLFVSTPEPIYISKNKVAEFKNWFTD